MTFHHLRAPQPAASPPAARQPGPVTMALRAMQSGIPETERERVRALRRRIADRIEADIALLDMLSGDPDLDADLTVYRVQPDGSFATVGITSDDEPSLCGIGGHMHSGHHHEWPGSGYGNIDPHDLEEENEHGSDDDQGEETLGWPANIGQLALGPNTADGDATALESFGAGFRRSGHEDDEDTCDREGMTDDNGIADAAGAWDAGFADFGAHVWPSTGDMLGERHS